MTAGGRFKVRRRGLSPKGFRVSTGDVFALRLNKCLYPCSCVSRRKQYGFRRPLEDETRQLQHDVSGHPRLELCSSDIRAVVPITPLDTLLPSIPNNKVLSLTDVKLRRNTQVAVKRALDVDACAMMTLCVPSVLGTSANPHSLERRSIWDTLLVRLGHGEARSICCDFWRMAISCRLVSAQVE